MNEMNEWWWWMEEDNKPVAAYTDDDCSGVVMPSGQSGQVHSLQRYWDGLQILGFRYVLP